MGSESTLGELHTLDECKHAFERSLVQNAEHMRLLKECFFAFSADPDNNISHLAALAGKALHADCALYNHLSDNRLLCSLGQWQTPPDFKPEDSPEGHICYDVILENPDEPYVVRDLLSSKYAQTDPNVLAYGLKTYIGIPVRLGNKATGSLCVVFTREFEPTAQDLQFLAVVATALGVEEKRKQSETALTRAEHEHARLQEHLLQSQKMKAVGTLAAGVAHDFNNILQAIVGNMFLLKGMLPSESKILHLTGDIEGLCDRATKLIRNLLIFSKQQAIDARPIDLNALIQYSQEVFCRITGEGITCSMNLADNALMVCADPFQLQQVLINIVENARDAMPHGGSLTIATKPSVAAGTREEAVLEISDTGTGIAECDLPHIFEPFYTTKEVGSGTGLGLAVAFGIIQQHEGSIEAENAPCGGTTFRIRLPITNDSSSIRKCSL